MKYLTTFLLSIVCILSAYGQEADDVLLSENSAVPTRAKVAATDNAILAFDVNGDGKVNAIDVVDIVKYTRKSQRSVFKVANADVNGDGKVDIEDAKKLSDLITGGEMPASTPTTQPEQPETPEETTDDTDTKPGVISGDSVIDPVGP